MIDRKLRAFAALVVLAVCAATAFGWLEFLKRICS